MDGATAIRTLIVAYCERLDAGDFDGVADLFAHGAFRSPRGTNLVGSAAVRSQYDALVVYPDGTPRTKHVLGSVSIDADDVSGTGTSRCAFTVFHAAESGDLQPVLSGRYHDQFERVDGEWRFTERMVLPDLEGDLGRHMRGRA
jgi:SnoaL-like domain